MKNILLLLIVLNLTACSTCYALAVMAGFYQEREEKAYEKVNAYNMSGSNTNPNYNPKN
jgi:NADH:ubiquinone oxidoreductase subunit K